MSKDKILCVIGARGGSKGVPNKNIKDILGKPLIAWTISQAKKSSMIDRVIVSTDSREVAYISKNYGAEVPFIRPSELAQDSSPKFDIFKHALSFCEKKYKEEYDIYVDLDCTNPLRETSDIDKAIKLFIKNRKTIDALITICEARKNPYFNLLEQNERGHLKLSKKNIDFTVVRRQDAPKVYELVASINILSPKYIKKSSNLLDGNIIGYDIGNYKSLDIDSSFDFEIIEYLMGKRNEI